jgi:hypothetical protein
MYATLRTTNKNIFILVYKRTEGELQSEARERKQTGGLKWVRANCLSERYFMESPPRNIVVSEYFKDAQVRRAVSGVKLTDDNRMVTQNSILL